MKSQSKLAAFCIFATASLGAFCGASFCADRFNGQRIAERWCAQCHIVASGQKEGSDQVPSFAQISSSGRFDEKSFARFLAVPHHAGMPDLSLTHSEVDDLWDYLKTRRDR